VVLVQEGKRIDPEEVFNGRGSLAGLLEKLAAEPGQWIQFDDISNGGIATQIKKHKGFDARVKQIKGTVPARFTLQACYVGPDFVAEIIPRVRKPKPHLKIETNVPLP